VRREHFQALGPVCPVCRTESVAHPLRLEQVFEEQGPHVLQGLIRCTNPACRREYPIIDGVPMLVAAIRHYIEHNLLGLVMRADLAPEIESVIGDCSGSGSAFDIHRQHLSHYASDHWGDLDPGLPPADRAAAGTVVSLLDRALALAPPAPQGPILDLGCSVGRSTFELAARTGRMVVGIDLNLSMLRVASRALREGRISYSRRRVGLVYDRRDYPVDLPAADLVDFWQCDVLALPLPPWVAGLINSLNLLDCLPSPMDHLASIAGLLRPDGRALLATPYDWSTAATALESWIGGHSQRGETGGASDATLHLALGMVGLRALAEDPSVEWTVRLHERSRVTYRSHLLVLAKDV